MSTEPEPSERVLRLRELLDASDDDDDDLADSLSPAVSGGEATATGANAHMASPSGFGGTRASHVPKILDGAVSSLAPALAAAGLSGGDDTAVDMDEVVAAGVGMPLSGREDAGGEAAGEVLDYAERAKYIPMRLTAKERKLLRLVKNAVRVLPYTDRVDKVFRHAAKRTMVQIKNIAALCSGIITASAMEEGRTVVDSRDFNRYAKFLRRVFEVYRRHQVSNPDCDRDLYVKLIYILQDSQSAGVQELLGFSLVKEIKTVATYLRSVGAEGLLHEPALATATREIMPEGKSRPVINAEIKAKERAQRVLARKYMSSRADEDDIAQAIYSMADNFAYLRFARVPVVQLQGYLASYFDPQTVDGEYSLAIAEGVGGARLTHGHARQFQFVNQTLRLWSAVTFDMFHLWYLADADLLDPASPYELRDTGQGLNRVQAAPRIARAMRSLVNTVQASFRGAWVGSAVVHVGDDMVPNALAFIDKYNAVARACTPIVTAVNNLGQLVDDDNIIESFVNSAWTDLPTARLAILHDLFLHAFDGSGGANFIQAGSCIDGRLTSLWSWCQALPSKPYYDLFKLTGFVGFDGEM
ncbi:uncharacterized protein AMSG_07586 [Thecamonas trahens ATCC 50062]|uniref:Non-canonical E2 ubiquitin-conjugating enzyme C-terminal domain-containing protein n=1 Tax=Thecamonas trahens ATCC 50062 TaxID=461836 RepID=A0A0L0DGE2_THETB|nr:hypothetical protein AMSG_07586 [Thecamonas trahens ATCC 50062]KNC51402.1 hypothetical protein AMSG_07586 [Thecamonas trahens ATCC 50062]|eukprot:XP_013756069.1 hypothetical protein AMSG_07586 [Thecamonas trahens ATCC 50062]